MIEEFRTCASRSSTEESAMYTLTSHAVGPIGSSVSVSVIVWNICDHAG